VAALFAIHNSLVRSPVSLAETGLPIKH
jgi:hypothetical protein